MARLGARFGARVVGVFAASVVLCAMAAPATQAGQLTRGFADDVWFTGGAPWVQRTVATGAKLVLIEVDWSSLEPSAPRAGVDPSDPSGPQYDFGWLDPVVREFAGTGVSVAFFLSHAPRWAEASGGPSDLEALGAWKPNATAFGQAARALARRYSGTYPDPENLGKALPRVKYFEGWAEPNLALHLAPQWTKHDGHWRLVAPGRYRNLLNAFYAGVKSVHSDNFVMTAGFAPFGDRIGSDRIDQARTPPAQFVRSLMCLNGRRSLTPKHCANPAHFDAISMDPYETSTPTTHAANPDDVSAPDLGKLTRIVSKAVRVGNALPRARKQLWVTEFSYDSNPPNPTAVSTAIQARWLEEALYVFWREHASTVVWYLVRDQGGTDWSTSYYSGVYFRDGQPKPSFTAYRFPFVVMGSTAWGIAPSSGRLAVQRRVGSSWDTLFSVSATAGAVFTHQVSAGLHGYFRAVLGGEDSLVWHK
jgi:hypothetical protein